MKSKQEPFSTDFLGMTVVGERGQVVIPKEIRDVLGLKSGARLLVLHHGNGALVMLPAENMKNLMEKMNKKFTNISKLMKS